MSAISQRPSPWVWALGLSMVLHALGLGRALLSAAPAPTRAAGRTMSVFVVPSPGVAAPPSAPAQATSPPLTPPAPPRPARRKPTPVKSSPPPVQAPPTATTQPTAPAPPPEDTTTTTTTPIVPMTAGLFSPITQQSWGQGRWGRGPRATSPDALAQQAQQPLVLRMTVQSRLAAMSEVMRQSQLSPACHIRIHPSTLQAQLSCQPESLQSAAWSSLQGLVVAGDVPPSAEVWCLHWTAWEATTTPCSDVSADANPTGPTTLSP